MPLPADSWKGRLDRLLTDQLGSASPFNLRRTSGGSGTLYSSRSATISLHPSALASTASAFSLALASAARFSSLASTYPL